MECWTIDIDLGDELDVAIDVGDELEVEINFEGDVNVIDNECPIIYEIWGGDADRNFAPINGFLNGGDADPFA